MQIANVLLAILASVHSAPGQRGNCPLSMQIDTRISGRRKNADGKGCICYEGMILNSNKNGCYCPTGTTLNPSGKVCEIIEDQNTLHSGCTSENNQSIPVCVGGQTFNSATNQCECPNIMVLVKDGCDCPPNLPTYLGNSLCGDKYIWETSRDIPTCLPGQKVQKVTDKCIPQCVGGQSFNPSNYQCECPNFMVVVEDGCNCPPQAPHYLGNSSCGDLVPLEILDKVPKCPSGEMLQPVTDICVPIPRQTRLRPLIN